MTDNQHGPAQGEPIEPRQPGEAAPGADLPAETVNPAPADQTTPAAPAVEDGTSSPAASLAGPQAAPTVPAAPHAAPAAPAAAAAPAADAPAAPAAAAPAAPQAPAGPTGTVYAPGQSPQPYHAPQYNHQAAATPQPGYGSQAGSQTAPQHSTAGHGASGHHAQTQPTEPFPGGYGSVPPAFGGPTGPGAAPQPAAEQPKPRRVGLGVAAAIVAAALVGGASGAGIATVLNGDSSSGTVQSSATGTQNIVVNDTDSVNEITAVAAKASPSVVTISVAGGQGAGTGSGIILSDDGYVLTNTHVVTLDGTTGEATIQVKTSDGRLYGADLVGTDPLSDLAVIKLQEASGLQPLEFADSDELNVGDVAIAIGAPLGLAGTVTNGIVSALNRSIDVKSSAAPATPEDGEDQGQGGQQPFDFWNFDIPGQQGQGQQTQAAGTISIPVIQTDAAINPGNSGGALVDSEGKLIGVNVAILSAGGASGEAGNIGVGFAVPANLAQRVSKEIIETGSATHGLLGATVTSAQADEEATTVGALITELTQGGAAAAAGLQQGDVVTKFNGVPITDQTDLTAQVRAQAGGAKAQLTYVRGGETKTVDVTLGTFEG